MICLLNHLLLAGFLSKVTMLSTTQKVGFSPLAPFNHTKELDRRRVNKAQSANQNKGLNNDVQNACELLIIEILQNLFRLNQA